MADTLSPAAAFALDLEAAVRLRQASYARQLDEELVASGGRIVYAIDSAILNFLFLENLPKKNARSKVPETDAGKAVDDWFQIFRGPGSTDEAESASDELGETPKETPLKTAQAQLRRVLLWYILEGGAPSDDPGFQNLVLLPGHVIEVRKLYDGIVSQFEQQRQRLTSLKRQATEIAELAQSAGEAPADAKEKRDALMSTLSNLAASISDPHDKFDRINSLIQRGQIMSLRAAAANAAFDWDELTFGDEHIFEAESAAIRDDDPEIEGSWSWWNSELHGRLPSRYAPLDRDALSTLDRINRQLDPLKARVILFTDNASIIEAGHQYKPFNRRRDGLKDLSFSDLYLRHPTSLLVDPRFARPSADVTSGETLAATEADGWLRALLDETLEPAPDEYQPGENDAGACQQAALDDWLAFKAGLPSLDMRIADKRHLNKILVRSPDLHKRFTDRWADYLSNLHYQYQLNSPVASSKLADIVKLYDPNTAEDVETFLADIKDHLNFLTEKSWTTFFNTVADTGLELISWPALEARSSVWPVPVVFIQGDRLLSDVIQRFWHPNAVRRHPKEVLHWLNDPAFQATLPRSYVYALCYGQLFAHAERWPLTRLLAQRALRISGQLKKEVGTPYIEIEDGLDAKGNVRVSGREASYLLAVSTRVNAQDVDDLSDALKALDVSINSADDFAENTEEVSVKVTGVRFEAESIAIALARMVANKPAADMAEVRGLRERIVAALESAGDCDEELVRTHAQISLRSELFLSLQFSLPTAMDEGIDPTVLAGLPSSIETQISDIEFVYGEEGRSGLETAPLRDRALLRLAATFANDLSLLPDWMHLTTVLQDRNDPVSGIRPLDRRQLVAIEREVSRLERTSR